MYIEKIPYTTDDGQQGVHTVHFRLQKMEVMKMAWSVPGGIKALFEKIVEEQDIHKILLWTEEILSKAYGVKSADGKRFIKTDTGWKEFTESDVYDDWMFHLITHPKKMATVMNAIMPDVKNLELKPEVEVDPTEASSE